MSKLDHAFQGTSTPTLTSFICRPPDIRTVRSSESGSVGPAEPAGVQSAAVAGVPPAVVTRVPLPAQDWGAPALEAAAEWPHAVTAGVPFELTVQLRNRTHHLVDLGVRLGDTSGFVLSGAVLFFCELLVVSGVKF